MGEFSRMIKEDYGLRKKPITARNPQANSIIERVHQRVGQMLRTFRVQDTENLVNPLDGILAAISFALRATVHTTTQYTPTQIVFGRDHILNLKQEIDWKKIKENKSTLIQRNNERENNKRVKYTYTIGQKVIIKTEQSRKYGKDAYEGPYEVVEVRNNGSLRLRKTLGRGAVFQTFNLRNIFCYHEGSNEYK